MREVRVAVSSRLSVLIPVVAAGSGHTILKTAHAAGLRHQFRRLFKATSLAMAIGVAEMTDASHRVEKESFKTFEAFALASVFYWTVSFLIMGLGHGRSA